MSHKTDTLVSDTLTLKKKHIKSFIPVCKICFLYKNPITLKSDLISPCNCKGSIKYVHKTCLRLWRFKGKNIREIKRCEQCLCEYKYLGDYIPHNFLVRFTTMFVIFVMFFMLHVLLSFLLHAVMFLINDDVDENISYNDFLASFQFRQYHEQIMDNENINEHLNNVNYKMNMKQKHERSFYRDRLKFGVVETGRDSVSLSFKTSVVIVASVYVFAFWWSLWPMVNLFFTIWRVYMFDFWFDRYFLGFIILYYVHRFYRELYARVDTLYVFVLNYNA